MPSKLYHYSQIVWILASIFVPSSSSTAPYHDGVDESEIVNELDDFESNLANLKQQKRTLTMDSIDTDSDSQSLSSTTMIHECRTMETTVEIQKEEGMGGEEDPTHHQSAKRCQGSITMNKCEGGCVSNLRPSINTATGLVKECNCCRETMMQAKHVTLDSCFDLDGNVLDGETMTITINEPHQCGCFKCSN